MDKIFTEIAIILFILLGIPILFLGYLRFSTAPRMPLLKRDVPPPPPKPERKEFKPFLLSTRSYIGSKSIKTRKRKSGEYKRGFVLVECTHQTDKYSRYTCWSQDACKYCNPVKPLQK